MFLRGVMNNLRGGVGGGRSIELIRRHFSKKRAENVRKINPKVPHQEASVIAQSMYEIIKQQGPLTVPNTWNHLKDAGLGLNSKTHMKLILKWMRGRKMLKLICNQVGSNKKFLHSTLPDEPSSTNNSLGVKLETEKPEPKLAKKPKQKRKKVSKK